MPDEYELRHEHTPAPEPRFDPLFDLDDAAPNRNSAAVPSRGAGGAGSPVRRPASPVPSSRWRFYATVYFFPWRREVIRHWFLLAGGLTPALVLLALVIQPTPFANLSQFGRVALLFLGTPLIIVLLATVAYAAAAFISVVEATAAGADRMETWPDDEWVEWLGQLLHLGYAAAVAAALSYGAVSLVLAGVRRWIELPSGTLPAAVYATFLIFFFPIVLLSTLHAVFGWLPLTRSVLRSLAARQTDAAWALFAITCVPLALLPLAQFIYAPAQYLVYAAAGLGPQIATGLLIYARLLGRLGWEIGEHLPEQASPDEDDDDAGPFGDGQLTRYSSDVITKSGRHAAARAGQPPNG